MIPSFIGHVVPCCLLVVAAYGEATQFLGRENVWTSFSTSVGSYVVTYTLPKGDDFSPYPKSALSLSTTAQALGGVAFGLRPQGRELAKVLLRVEIYPLTQTADHRLSADELLQTLQSQERVRVARAGADLLSRLASLEVKALDTTRWVLEERVDAETGRFWGEKYCLALDRGHYLVVSTLLSSSASQDTQMIAESRSMAERVAQSVTISP
jgi:hypothetical protein